MVDINAYKDLLEENKKLKEENEWQLKSMISAKEDIDSYCDFDILIKQLKKQDKKFKDMKELLEKCVKYFENGCSDEEKWLIAQDIKKVLK